MTAEETVDAMFTARDRVDYRLTYGCTDKSRQMDKWSVYGPDLPNSYWHMRGGNKPGNTNPDFTSETGAGEWSMGDGISDDATEDEHIETWFETAIREAVHESMEWFWVDGSQYLDPHGRNESLIHELSGEFARKLIALRGERKS